MDEIKIMHTGDDPMNGSDPVSVKSIKQKDEKADGYKAESIEQPVVQPLKRSAKRTQEERSTKRTQEERSTKHTQKESSTERSGPTVLKRERPRSVSEETKQRKKRRRTEQEAPKKKRRSSGQQRRKRKEIKWIKLVIRLVVLLIFAAAVAIVIMLNMFRLKKIKVTGNKNYSEEQIIEMTGIPSGGNTLLTYLKYKDTTVNDKPLIKHLRVYMADRNTIGIEVAETANVGQIKYNGKYYCFDDRGYVQEILETREKSVPKVTGISIEEAVLGAPIKTDDDSYFANIIELCQMLTERKIGADEIEVTGDNAIMIFIDDNICVAFGSPLLMEAKISEIANILPELLVLEKSEELKGTLHLENYSTFQKSIVFTPGELVERDSDEEDTGKKKKTRVKDDDQDEESEEETDETDETDESDTEEDSSSTDYEYNDDSSVEYDDGSDD